MAKRELLGGLSDENTARELRRLQRIFRDTFGVTMDQMDSLRKNRDVAVVLSEMMRAGKTLSASEVQSLGFTEAKSRQILDRLKRAGVRPVNPSEFFQELRRSGGLLEQLSREVEPLRSESRARSARRAQSDMLNQDRIRSSQQAARRVPGSPVDEVRDPRRGGPLSPLQDTTPSQRAGLEFDRRQRTRAEARDRASVERDTRERAQRSAAAGRREDVFGDGSGGVRSDRQIVLASDMEGVGDTVEKGRKRAETRAGHEAKRAKLSKAKLRGTILRGVGAATVGGFLATLAFDAIVNGTRRSRENALENAVNLRRAEASPLAAAEFEAEMQSDTLDLMDRSPLGGLQRASAPVAQGLTRELGELMQAEARALRDFDRSSARKMQIGDLI